MRYRLTALLSSYVIAEPSDVNRLLRTYLVLLLQVPTFPPVSLNAYGNGSDLSFLQSQYTSIYFWRHHIMDPYTNSRKKSKKWYWILFGQLCCIGLLVIVLPYIDKIRYRDTQAREEAFLQQGKTY